MGNGAAQAAGLEQAETTVEDSVAGMTDIVSFASSIPIALDGISRPYVILILCFPLQIDKATRETGSGPLLDFRRKELPW